MDILDDEDLKFSGTWSAPPADLPESKKPRVMSCVCARCRNAGPCEDFDRIDFRWYHRGECARLQQQG